MLDQRRRRCADVVQMLYKCFVFFYWVGYMVRTVYYIVGNLPGNANNSETYMKCLKSCEPSVIIIHLKPSNKIMTSMYVCHL